jgi:hypothetical protein
MSDKEDDIFSSCLQVPKEFWRLCNCCAPLLVRSDPKQPSDSLRSLFRSIGERIRTADPQYSAGLFNDYCLPKIALTLRVQPSMFAAPSRSAFAPNFNAVRRRAALLELSNAYVVPEMRLQVELPCFRPLDHSHRLSIAADVQRAAVGGWRLERVHHVPCRLRAGASPVLLSISNSHTVFFFAV